MTVTVADFTGETTDGTGVFDIMMRAAKSHIVAEYNNNRIKGPEYATVYLGMLNGVMDRSMEFLLAKDKTALELLIMQAELEKIEIEKTKVTAEVALVNAQVLNTQAELLRIQAQTRLLDRQELNAEKEGREIEARICKLAAEFDLIMAQIPKVAAEVALLNQKVVTEQAQTSSTAIDPDSVVGKQISLYTKQAQGFTRDAEQKVAKLMIDTWNVRRTTDDQTIPSTAGLDDTNIVRAVNKMLGGIDA